MVKFVKVKHTQNDCAGKTVETSHYIRADKIAGFKVICDSIPDQWLILACGGTSYLGELATTYKTLEAAEADLTTLIQSIGE